MAETLGLFCVHFTGRRGWRYNIVAAMNKQRAREVGMDGMEQSGDSFVVHIGYAFAHQKEGVIPVDDEAYGENDREEV